MHRILWQEHNSGGQGEEAVFIKSVLCVRSCVGSNLSKWELVGVIIWEIIERWFLVVIMV